MSRKWHGAHAEKQARNYGDERRLGIIPYRDRTLASNRMRYLQLVRALKRDMVNLIEADEVRERVGVFLVDKPGKDTQRRIFDARVSNLHLLPPPGVSLVTSEGLSRRRGKRCRRPWETVDIGRFVFGSRRRERCLSQIQNLKTVQLLLCPSCGGRPGSGSRFGWTRVHLF